MNNLAWVLKLGSPIFFIVGGLHLVMGLGADVLLGATIDAEAIADPVLDSQNRFYGVAFALYGVLFYLCASDIPKYSLVLKAVLWMFFAAGLARLVSIGVHGMPSLVVVGLLVVELFLPPALVLWLNRVLGEA